MILCYLKKRFNGRFLPEFKAFKLFSEKLAMGMVGLSTNPRPG
tara:strand:- start:2050 stop:2178 length:129 start_codon:yes stop_codon:yes gene_type:complete